MWKEEWSLKKKKKKKKNPRRKGIHQNISGSHYLKGLQDGSSPAIHPISPSAFCLFLSPFFRPQARNDLSHSWTALFLVLEVLVSSSNFGQESVSWPLQTWRPLSDILKKKNCGLWHHSSWAFIHQSLKSTWHSYGYLDPLQCLMAGVLTMLEDSVEQGAQRYEVCIPVSAAQHTRTGMSAPHASGSWRL